MKSRMSNTVLVILNNVIKRQWNWYIYICYQWGYTQEIFESSRIVQQYSLSALLRPTQTIHFAIWYAEKYDLSSKCLYIRVPCCLNMKIYKLWHKRALRVLWWQCAMYTFFVRKEIVRHTFLNGFEDCLINVCAKAFTECCWVNLIIHEDAQ